MLFLSRVWKELWTVFSPIFHFFFFRYVMINSFPKYYINSEDNRYFDWMFKRWSSGAGELWRSAKKLFVKTLKVTRMFSRLVTLRSFSNWHVSSVWTDISKTFHAELCSSVYKEKMTLFAGLTFCLNITTQSTWK